MKAKRFLAALTATAILAAMGATSVSAEADGSTWGNKEVTGDNIVTSATIKYVIPTDLEFAIDAFQKGDETGSQIYSAGYTVINKSDVPISVSVSPKLQLKNDVELVSNPAETTPADTSDVDKRIYMEMVSAKALTAKAAPDTAPAAPSNDGTTAGTEGKVDFELPTFAADSFGDTGAKDQAKVLLNVVEANMTFDLQAAKYVADGITATPGTLFDSVAVDKTDATKYLGATAFRFMGAVNPYADWQAADVTVSAVFDVYGMTKTMYDKAMTTPVANGMNIASLKNASKAPARDTSDSAPIVLPIATSGNDATIKLDLGLGEDAATGIKGIKIYQTGITAPKALTAAQYAFDETTNTLTLKAAAATAAYGKNGGKIEITFSKTGNNAYALTLELPYTSAT